MKNKEVERKEENKERYVERLLFKDYDSVFLPDRPSAAASCSAPALAHSSSQSQTAETPAQTPRMHLGCHGPGDRNYSL